MANRSTAPQVIKGLFDALVLRLLAQRDSYGFEIYHSITEQIGEDGALFRESTLYPLLHRLEEKGFIEPYWKPGERGTDRKYYRITKAGRQQLAARVEDWTTVARVLERTIFSDKDDEETGK